MLNVHINSQQDYISLQASAGSSRTVEICKTTLLGEGKKVVTFSHWGRWRTRERERPFFLSATSFWGTGGLLGTSGRSNISSSSLEGGTVVVTSGRSWSVNCVRKVSEDFFYHGLSEFNNQLSSKANLVYSLVFDLTFLSYHFRDKLLETHTYNNRPNQVK